MTTPTLDPEALIQRIIHAGERLPPEVRTAVIAAGAAVVPGLIRVLEDEALAMEDAPGEGFAPIHAVKLLHELRAPEAIEPMLRELVRSDPLDILHDRLLALLPDFGAAVLEPAWALLARTEDAEARASLLSVMAKLGVRDARIYRELLAGLEKEPERAAMDLAEYGDPDALPHLQHAFLRFKLNTDEGRLFANQALIELKAAIEDLGGALSPAMEAKMAQLDAQRRAVFARAVAAAPARARKVGRNDPCPCGSGRKHKKCCLGKG